MTFARGFRVVGAAVGLSIVASGLIVACAGPLGRTPRADDRATVDTPSVRTSVSAPHVDCSSFAKNGSLTLGPVARPEFIDRFLTHSVVTPDADGRLPVTFCFAPDTPEEVMEAYNELMLTDPTGQRYFLGGRWSGAQGTPRHLTWSFVPDGLIVDGSPSDLFARMDALFAGQGGRAVWIAQFEASFARWAELIGTTYTRLTNGVNDWDDGATWGLGGNGTTRGDVRIGMINIDGPSGILAYNYFPSNGDMVIDRSEGWGAPANNFRFLRNVIMHEHGHGLGMFHVCSNNSGQLMEPFLSTAFDGPQDDDIRGGQRHYGDPFESNSSVGTATNLGTVEPETPVSLGAVPAPNVNFATLLSIDADNKQDFFRFTITGPRAVTTTITPVGRVYDSSPQVGGSCTCCNNIDSQRMADLAVQIIDSNGVTVLATADSQPIGEPETIDGAFVMSAGNYYLRVYETNTPTEAQFYRLQLSVENIDCNNNGIPDPQDILDGTSEDCNDNLIPDECEVDCNENDIPDECDITDGTSEDCSGNGIPDECEPDCNNNGIADSCDIFDGTSEDCNGDGIPDECQLIDNDCNNNGIPDDCETDCNANGIPDDCDIVSGTSQDCNNNEIPDECDVSEGTSTDCNHNFVPDECEADCNNNGIADECEIIPVFEAQSPELSPLDLLNPKSHLVSPAPESTGDVKLNFLARADLGGASEFVRIRINGVEVGAVYFTGSANECDQFSMDTLIISAATYNGVLGGTEEALVAMVPSTDVSACAGSFIRFVMSYPLPTRDCDGNSVLDECELSPFTDCNDNGVIDVCEIASGVALDCNENDIPDECDIASETSQDCNDNGIPDECETDCNGNNIPDDCDLTSGTSQDCNNNGVPDECDIASETSLDCNENNIPDECDIAAGTSRDCNYNGIPDECEIASGAVDDLDKNGIPDECEIPELVVFVVSPEAEPGTGRTVAEAKAWGQAPIIPIPDCEQPLTATVQVWLQINPVGPNYDAFGYTTLTNGGFDLVGSNNSVKGDSFQLFRTFNTPAAQRRWDSVLGSNNGGVGGSGYVWQNTTFSKGFSSGVSSLSSTPPIGYDEAPDAWLLGTMQLSITDPTTIAAGPGGFFDVYFELNNSTWLTGPNAPVGHLAWGFDDQDETFVAHPGLNPRRKSTHPELRLRVCGNDCNNNGVDDAIDIAEGTSRDCNNNGIPDECEESMLLDVPSFVALLLGEDDDPVRICQADINGDGFVNGDDIQLYIDDLNGS
jgi:serralysin